MPSCSLPRARPTRTLVPTWLVVVGITVSLLASLPPTSSANRSPVGNSLREVTSTPPLSGHSPSAAPALVNPITSVTPTWVNVTGAGLGRAPPRTSSSAMAYDPVDQESVLFGGCSPSQCPDNQTWAFSNGTWVNLTNPKDAPPARLGASMDFDPNMGGLLLFGGAGASSNYLNDTWLFRGGEWTNLSYVSSVSPPARVFSTMTFDPQPEENGSVLFGGFEPSLGPGYGNDTWVWQSWTGWTFLNTSTRPPVSDLAQMTYDPAEQAVVLFGCGDGCVDANATWELYSGQWWPIAPPNPIPPYRYGAAMIYDPSLSGVLMFGGWGFSGAMNDLWLFAGGVWTSESFGTPPPGRYVSAISPGASSSPVLLFGGSKLYPFGTPDLNDTWVLEIPPTVTISAAPTTAEPGTPVKVTATVNNGTPPFLATFAFGDHTFEEAASLSSSISVTHEYLGPGAFDPSVNVTDSGGVRSTAAAAPGVRVTAGPSLAPVSAPGPGDVGYPLAFVASAVSNGTAPFTFRWEFGDGSNGTGSQPSHTFTAPGTFHGSLTVVDALSVSATQGFSVVVSPLPSVSLQESSARVVAHANDSFRGVVSGGTPPYTYSWRFGDGATSTFPSPSHNYSAAGNFTVQLWANDSFGAGSHASTVVAVTPASHGPPPPPPPPPATSNSTAAAGVPSWFWPGVAGLAVAGAAGGFLLLRRGRTPSS